MSVISGKKPSINSFNLLVVFALIGILLVLLTMGFPAPPIGQVAVASTFETWQPVTPHLEIEEDEETCDYRLYLERHGIKTILNPSAVKIEPDKGAVFHFNITKSDAEIIFWPIFRGNVLFPYFNDPSNFPYDARIKITHPWPELGESPVYEFEYESRPNGRTSGPLMVEREAILRLEELCHCQNGEDYEDEF